MTDPSQPEPIDPCQQELLAVQENREQQQEIEDFIPEAPFNLRPKLKAQLEKLRKDGVRLAGRLSACREAHHPPPDPVTPQASLRSETAFGSPVAAVTITGTPQRRAVAVQQQLTAFTILNTDTGEVVQNQSVPGVIGPPVLSPTGEFFVVASSDKILRVFNIDGSDRWRAGHSAGITAAAVSPRTGNLIATGAGVGDKKVRMFTSDLSGDDPANHRPVWENPQQTAITHVAISADDKVIAAACKDRSVRLFDADNGDTVKIFPHDSPVQQLGFSPSGAVLAIVDGDGTVKLIDISTLTPTGGETRHPAAVTAASFSFDGTMLATATTEPDNKVRVWKLAGDEPEEIYTFAAQTATITAIMFSPAEIRLAIGSSTNAAFIVDPTTRLVDRELPNAISTAIAYSADGKLLIVGTANAAKVFNTG
jgi:WD40 repeat protein